MSKKTETLELRLSPELKGELGKISQANGEPMSQIVRELLEREIVGAPPLNPRKDNFRTQRTMANMVIGGAGILTIAAFTLLADTNPALAQAAARMTFAEYDLNGDGQIANAEFKEVENRWMVGAEEKAEDASLSDDPLPAACEAEFALDGGELSEDELAMFEAHTSFSSFDLNGDNIVDFEEVRTRIEADLTQTFMDIDADGDGLIDTAEFSGEGDVSVSEDDFADLSTACAAALTAQYASLSDEEAAPMDADDLRVVYAALDVNMDGRLTVTKFVNNF